jgi:hypothetical protein
MLSYILGVLLGAGILTGSIIKLSLWWTEKRVNEVKDFMKKNDISEDERQLLELLIEDYDRRKRYADDD